MRRKPTSPAQRQEIRITWADLEPHRQLMLATKAAWLGLGLLADCHGAGGLVQCPPFAKRGGGKKGVPFWLQCSKREVAARTGLYSSFCCASTLRHLSGLSLCLAVAYATSKGSSWAVAHCLYPGPCRQTWPQHNSCAEVCSCHCFQDKKDLAIFMTGIFLLHLRSLSSHPEVFL